MQREALRIFDERDYPRGAELYISDLEGNNVHRLTVNEWYDAEVSVSPDGEWIVFGRQTDGKMDLWRMHPDGSDEQQITKTEDWLMPRNPKGPLRPHQNKKSKRRNPVWKP